MNHYEFLHNPSNYYLLYYISLENLLRHQFKSFAISDKILFLMRFKDIKETFGASEFRIRSSSFLLKEYGTPCNINVQNEIYLTSFPTLSYTNIDYQNFYGKWIRLYSNAITGHLFNKRCLSMLFDGKQLVI